MEPIRLHSYRRCPFAIRVRMVLEEKAIPFESIEESLRNPSQELLRLHPQGKVPLLVYGEQAIFESSIITEFLDDLRPEPPLMPADAIGRAQVRLWTYWCNEIFKPDLDAFKYRWKDLGDEERKQLRERLQSHLDQLNESVDGQYLLGQEFSLADIHVFPFFRQLKKAHPDFAQLFQTGSLDGWLEKIQSRPSFDRVMQKKD